MERRLFLGVCTATSASLLFSSGQKPKTDLSDEVYALIEAVQQHLFPENGTIPSAKSFNAIQFLAETIVHPTYDKDIRKYVIKGAKKLHKRTKEKFLSFDAEQKEKALREYEETSYGSRWLDRIMLLSLEGLLSDPIYEGNSQESGWEALQTFGGDPRPTARYAGL